MSFLQMPPRSKPTRTVLNLLQVHQAFKQIDTAEVII